MKPQNFPEKLVWYYIIGTYIIYFMGAQYVFGPMLAYILTFYLLRKWWMQTDETPPEERITLCLSNWVWIVCILLIEVALIAGHIDYNLGLTQIAKSSVNGWLRNWVLLALFPLAAHLKIRPQLIYRAVAILCVQSLILVPIGYLAYAANLPSKLYTSPLSVFGGSDLYNVYLMYQFDPADEKPRMFLFAPWAPALGLVANIYFWLSAQDSSKVWRWLGMAGAVAMIISSASRLSLVALFFVPLAMWGLSQLVKPWMQFTAGFASALLGMYAPTVIEMMENFKRQFTQARAKSSYVRALLGRIAIYRWRTEAPIWGHGIIEPQGPKVVENMPIGSHHTWFGLVFLHGLVGCLALGFAFLWSFTVLLVKSYYSQVAKVGFAIMIILFLFTFAESIQALAYIYWPGLIIVGMGLKDNAVVREAS
ncbi:O-antigen ligase family protein [Phormidium sp. CCY1219]|uniref:O-antigen ligase family protein n=1 Tax=Phormidium sp. CCY1219 TaxID=2886104 RepID=UPI002D1E72A0|nr:O-antigen ligase domain-containing protein [Phormidium sp. CCY1219]MEB3830748.1 O-antigen ligase domain-containing protein [Phormidium sp. CCY1219]